MTPVRIKDFISKKMSGKRGKERGPVHLGPRRIYILPTREGLAYAAVVAVILLGSLNYQSSLGFFLSFLLLSMGLASMVKTQKNLSGVIVDVKGADPVFAGGKARFPVNVGNGGKARFSLKVKNGEGGGPAIDVSGKEGETELFSVFPRRGVWELGRVTVETRHPLTLFVAWSPFESAAPVVVYPKPLAGGFDQANSLGGDGPDGGPVPSSGNEDFAGLKEYKPGDPLTRLDWKAFARTGIMAVKEFESPARAVRVFDYEKLYGIEPEKRLSLLCGAVLEAERRKIDYGLDLPGYSIPPSSGPGHKRACLAALAGFKP